MKKLLPLILILTIISLASGGTMALYTMSSEITGTASIGVFYLEASGNSGKTKNISLYPGEPETAFYKFDVTNYRPGGAVCDYALSLLIRSEGLSSAFNSMPGLEISLYDVTGDAGKRIATLTEGELSYGQRSDQDILFPAGVETTKTYELRAYWRDNGDHTNQTAAGGNPEMNSVKIIVAGSTYR